MNVRIQNLLKNYNRILTFIGCEPRRIEESSRYFVGDKQTHLNHARWMVQHMLSEEWESKSEFKTNRWLGYIQGVMSCFGVTTLNDLKDQTRPIYNLELSEWEM